MDFYPLKSDFIDIHSHHTEREEGVFRIQNVFSSDFGDIPSDRPISIGLHPWHLSPQSIQDLPEVMKQALSFPNVMAIGEAGIDKVIRKTVEEQLPVFRKQIELAAKYRKPLIIHCVKAFPELLVLRKEFAESGTWIVHGFNANDAIARECVEAGIFISLSQRLFRNPEKAREIANVVPLSMIFAETDDDPMPIREVYAAISGLYGISLSELKTKIHENYIASMGSGGAIG